MIEQTLQSNFGKLIDTVITVHDLSFILTSTIYILNVLKLKTYECFCSFSPFFNFSIGVPMLSLKYRFQHVYWSGSGRVSHWTAIPDSPKHFLVSAIVSVWCVQMGWIPRLGSLLIFFLAISAPHLVLILPFDRRNSGLIFLR